MRYWAWLTTSSKGAKSARIELMSNDPIMPDIAPFSYLIDLVVDIGIRDLTWQEIESWIRLTGIGLTAWEMRTIKKLSQLYQVCAQRFNDSVLPAPYRDVEADVSETLEQDIKAALRN